MKRALSIIALALLGVACDGTTYLGNFDAGATVELRRGALTGSDRPQTTRFIDSQTFLPGNGTTYRTFGSAQLWQDNNLWVEGKGTAGARSGKIDWVAMTGYDGSTATGPMFVWDTYTSGGPPVTICTKFSGALGGPAYPTDWVGIGQYVDSSTLHFCSTNAGIGPLYMATSCADNNSSGDYRALGDGGLTNAQGGGVRAGVALFRADASMWVVAIKTGSTKGNNGACPYSGNSINFGPGAVGEWVIGRLGVNN